MTKTLIFPSSIPASVHFKFQAEARGEQVIGASSLAMDVEAESYDTWIRLPTIYEVTFDNTFINTIHDHEINAIFCPHSIIHAHIAKLLEQLHLPIKLINQAPAELDQQSYQMLLERAARVTRTAIPCTHSGLTFKLNEIAACLRYVEQIPGESDEDKIAALIAAIHDAPQGDVVEIGCLWGRSAFILAKFAHQQNIGNFLAIDPWQANFSLQVDAPDAVRADTWKQNWDGIFSGFCINMGLLPAGCHNYIRRPAETALAHYQDHQEVESPEFGRTLYTGKIGLLHIDGNHDYNAVLQDVSLWSPYLAPGGWLILDDYTWLHGDGPRLVGDQFLQDHAAKVANSFVIGTALFIKLKQEK